MIIYINMNFLLVKNGIVSCESLNSVFPKSTTGGYTDLHGLCFFNDVCMLHIIVFHFITVHFVQVTIHRAVLAACSPFFFELFERSSDTHCYEMESQRVPMYKLKDVCFTAFSRLLDYMYSGRLVNVAVAILAELFCFYLVDQDRLILLIFVNFVMLFV